MLQRNVHLIGGADDEVASVSATSTGRDRCTVVISYRWKVIKAECLDYFEALREVRKQMEVEALIPFCYGASLDVYPSGVSRDMAQGMVAYRTTLGRSTTRDDLVRIFDEGPDIILSYVAQQYEYHEKWIQSLES